MLQQTFQSNIYRRARCRPWGSTTRVLYCYDASHCEEQFLIRGAYRAACVKVQCICSTGENLPSRWTDDGGASLLQGGSPPTFLANSIVDYMLYGIEGVQLRINNIPDIGLQKVLKEV